jgi:GH18 family chitinase
MKRAFQAHQSDTHRKIKIGIYVYTRANQNVEKRLKKTSTALVQTDDPSQQKSDIRPSNSVRSLFCDAIEQESLVT